MRSTVDDLRAIEAQIDRLVAERKTGGFRSGEGDTPGGLGWTEMYLTFTYSLIGLYAKGDEVLCLDEAASRDLYDLAARFLRGELNDPGMEEDLRRLAVYLNRFEELEEDRLNKPQNGGA